MPGTFSEYMYPAVSARLAKCRLSTEFNYRDHV
eukprot:SAG31_NODE_36288_length_314_cov_1.665116_1_plen_32_part_10